MHRRNKYRLREDRRRKLAIERLDARQVLSATSFAEFDHFVDSAVRATAFHEIAFDAPETFRISQSPLEYRPGHRDFGSVSSQEVVIDLTPGFVLGSAYLFEHPQSLQVGSFADSFPTFLGMASQSMAIQVFDATATASLLQVRVHPVFGDGAEWMPVPGLPDLGGSDGTSADNESALSNDQMLAAESAAWRRADASNMAVQSASSAQSHTMASIATSDSWLSRFIGRLGRSRSDVPRTDEEGGLVEIGHDDDSSADKLDEATLAEGGLEDPLLEFRQKWTEMVRGFLRSRTKQSVALLTEKATAALANLQSTRTAAAENGEGGMIEIATAELTSPVPNLAPNNLASPVVNGEFVPIDAGVGFSHEFELSTSPLTSRTPNDMTDSRSSRRSTEKLDSERPSKKPDVHSAAAALPLLVLGLVFSEWRDNDYEGKTGLDSAMRSKEQRR